MLVYICDLGVVEPVARVDVVTDVGNGAESVEAVGELFNLQKHALGLLKAYGGLQPLCSAGIELLRGLKVRAGIGQKREFHDSFTSTLMPSFLPRRRTAPAPKLSLRELIRALNLRSCAVSPGQYSQSMSSPMSSMTPASATIPT